MTARPRALYHLFLTIDFYGTLSTDGTDASGNPPPKPTIPPATMGDTLSGPRLVASCFRQRATRKRCSSYTPFLRRRPLVIPLPLSPAQLS
ncbi:hypothetical protein EDB89DRAFT_415968 [Lactarius sanguifluus]|nr:hypothetical protein EDB89DRAFT_415968 [Lactarius sanguifluus]